MKHQISSSIEIAAEPQAVWEHLTDLSSFSEWNPFIPSAEGDLAVGEQLSLSMQSPGSRAMTIRPKITEIAPTQTFEWLGHLGFPGVFDGRHRFELHATATGTTLVQSEKFSGILVRVFRRMLDSGTVDGFEVMNQALKTRVESAAAQPANS